MKQKKKKTLLQLHPFWRTSYGCRHTKMHGPSKKTKTLVVNFNNATKTDTAECHHQCQTTSTNHMSGCHGVLKNKLFLSRKLHIYHTYTFIHTGIDVLESF